MKRRDFLKLTGIAAICPKLPKPEPICATGDTCSSSQAISFAYLIVYAGQDGDVLYGFDPNLPPHRWNTKKEQWDEVTQ